jgi:hypothetical protein
MTTMKTPWCAAQRSGGGSGEAVGLPTDVCSFGRSNPLTLRSSMANLGSQASYRHGGRDPLTTDLMKTPPIKALIGDMMGSNLVSKPTLDIEINLTKSTRGE